jgi:hypothetical protein
MRCGILHRAYVLRKENNKYMLDVSLVHLNEAVSTMYPLMQPSMNELAPQILNTQSTKDLTFPESSRYTCMTLLKAVDNALEKARE